MAKRKSRKIEEAVAEFGELPSEVLSLGKPLSIHPLGGLAKAFTPVKMRVGLYAIAALLFLISLGSAVIYLAGKPLGKAPPDVWLVIALPSLLICLFVGLLGWSVGRPSADGTDPNTVRGLILFADAIVRVTKAGFDIIRWDEVRELHPPASKSVWMVVAADGRRIALPRGVTEHTQAIIHITERVEAFLLPRFMAQLEAGQKVMFGPFGLSQRFVYSKGKKLAWKEVAGLKTLNGRLQVSRGGLLPWCDYNLMAYPNGHMAYELVRRLAPSQLLVPSNPNAWKR
jgi:hypothetical protein